MRFRHIYGALPLSAALLGAAQSFPASILTPDTDAFINQVLADWKTPGGAGVAVVRKTPAGGWSVETKGYGVADLNGTKVTENTRFAIASNSKLFDALAVGMLINNETLSPRISWTSKIADIIPGWGLMDPVAAKEATITDLMSHRTGMPRHDVSYRWTDDLPSIVKKLRSLRPSAEFRETWQYDNMMYMVLAHIPEVLAGTPYARFVKAHILDPLGMAATTYSEDVASASGQFAQGLTRNNGTVRAFPYRSTLSGLGAVNGEDGNLLSGPGGVISTAVDMATWLQTLLQKGVKPGTNTSVIPAAAINMVSTGITVATGTSPFPDLSLKVYGGGQIRGTYQGHDLIEHGGDITGFHSQVARLPFDNVGIAVLSNDNNVGPIYLEIIKYYLIELSLGLPHVDWTSRYKAAILASPAQPPPPRPANATQPQVKFQSLVGKYNNDGYGAVELCLFSPTDPKPSKACKDLISQAPTLFPGVLDSSVPTFLSVWNTTSAPWISFTHFNGNIFDVHALNSYPTGDPAQPFWATTTPGGPQGTRAELSVDGGHIGFGVTGVWGAGAGVPEPQGKTVRERAEAWFDKV